MQTHKLQAFVSWDKCEKGLFYPGEVVNLATTAGPLHGGCDDKHLPRSTCQCLPARPPPAPLQSKVCPAVCSWSSPKLPVCPPRAGEKAGGRKPRTSALWWARCAMTTPAAQSRTGPWRWNPASLPSFAT